MFVQKVRKVANPRGKKRVARASNGRFLRKSKTRAKKRSSRANPAQLLTLGFVNPHKTRKRRKVNSNMATTTKRKSRKRSLAAKKAARTRKRHIMAKSNPVQRHRRRHTTARRTKRRNGTRVVVMAPRRRNGYKRNPMLFGQHVTMVQAAKMVAGGLVGVTATKAIVPMLPGTLTSSPIGATVAAIAVAVAGGWAIGKVSSEFGNAFMFGGLMQAGSVLLNAYVPGASQFALQGGRGLGEFVPGSFAVPQNPVLLNAPSMSVGGAAGRPAVNRAYPRPY